MIVSGDTTNAVGATGVVFDLFVVVVVSVYLLLERNDIKKFLKKLSTAIFDKKTNDKISNYCSKGNKIFFTFITSQVLDAFIVGTITSIAMTIMNVKYSVLLGFFIGLFNEVSLNNVYVKNSTIEKLNDDDKIGAINDNFVNNYDISKTNYFVGDAAYLTNHICKTIIDLDMIPALPYSRLGYKKGYFKKYEFIYDEHNDIYICPNGKDLISNNRYNKDGYNQDGYNRQGYDKDGYDKDGYDYEGWDKDGVHKETGTEYGPDGYNKDGYDENGFDRDGYDKDGLDKDGNPRPEADGGLEDGQEAGTEGGAEEGTEGGSEGDTESGTEGGSEGDTESGTEGGSEGDTEGGSEGDTEGGSETETEGETTAETAGYAGYGSDKGKIPEDATVTEVDSFGGEEGVKAVSWQKDNGEYVTVLFDKDGNEVSAVVSDEPFDPNNPNYDSVTEWSDGEGNEYDKGDYEAILSDDPESLGGDGSTGDMDNDGIPDSEDIYYDDDVTVQPTSVTVHSGQKVTIDGKDYYYRCPHLGCALKWNEEEKDLHIHRLLLSALLL